MNERDASAKEVERLSEELRNWAKELGILMVAYITIKLSILLILKQVFLNSDTSTH